MHRSGIGSSPYRINFNLAFMSRKKKKARSASTGQFVPMSYAEKHPNTTVVETVKVGPTKKRK